MKKILYFSLFLSFVSCVMKTDPANEADGKQALRMELSSMKDSLKQNLKNFDITRGNQMIEKYKQYADQYAADSATPDYLFEAGNLCISVKRYQDAISFFERINKYYPDYSKRVESLFMIAFVYDEHLNMKGKAADVYQEVIDRYPNHLLANDAKVLIEHLTKTDDQLIKMFKEKNAAS